MKSFSSFIDFLHSVLNKLNMGLSFLNGSKVWDFDFIHFNLSKKTNNDNYSEIN